MRQVPRLALIPFCVRGGKCDCAFANPRPEAAIFGLFFDGSSERGSNRAFAGSKIRVPFCRATKAAMSVALATTILFDSGKLVSPWLRS